MAQDLVPSGSDGSLVVTVDSRKAIAGVKTIEARVIQMATRTSAHLDKMTSSFDRFQNFINRIASGLRNFLILREVFQVMEGFTRKVIDVDRAYQGFIASMNVIKGSVGKAREEYRYLIDISNRLGISVDSSISQFHRLAAALKNVDTTGELTRHLFSGISQAAVVLHAKGRDVTLIFEAVQQMASKGRLSLEELQRQLGNTLPGAVSMSARAMMESESFIKAGVKTASEAEQLLRKQIEKGTINVYEFLTRLAQQLKKEYGSGVKYASEQFTANFNRMKTAVWEFYRVASTSGMMTGLTKAVREITDLLNDPRNAEMMGQAFGQMFEDLANWISKLEPGTISEFFESVRTSITSTGTIVKSFFELFKDFEGPGMQTPLLNFVQMVMTAFATVVDVIKTGVASIKNLLATIKVIFYEAMNFILTPALKMAEMADAIGQRSALYKSSGVGEQIRGFRANLDSLRYDSSKDYYSSLGEFEEHSQGKTVQGVTRQFDDARRRQSARKYGDDMSPGYTPFGTDYSQPAEAKPYTGFGAAGYTPGQVPNFMLPRAKITSADPYVDPMGPEAFEKLVADIKARSTSPAGDKDGKGKSKKDPVQSNFLREQTRLLKDISVAETEYQNILDNQNRKYGVAEAQMRSLIATDERYIALSAEKQNQLIGWAKKLDEARLAVENAIKSQTAWNEAMQFGFDVQNRISEIDLTGYENQYRNLIDVMNSFKEGGENEKGMDLASRMKLEAAARKKDTDERILDMARFKVSVKEANEEMLFQASLYGKTAAEAEKLTEWRRIDLAVAKLSVGAAEEMIVAYQEMARVLKEDVANALDAVRSKQNDMMSGIRAGINAYRDSISNTADQMSQVTVNAFQGMEDAMVSFVETGKLSFSDLARSMAKDLARLIVRYLMLMMLQRMTGMMMNSGGGGAGFGDASSMNNLFNMPGGSMSTYIGGGGSAKGNVFSGDRMVSHAKGGIMDQMVGFPMAGRKVGTAFEAGPEAIMPLARDKSGSLGVKVANYSPSAAGGDGDLNLTVEIYQGEGNGVKTQRSSNEKGDILKILIGEVAADVQNGGQVHKSITQTFGLRRSPKSHA